MTGFAPTAPPLAEVAVPLVTFALGFGLFVLAMVAGGWLAARREREQLVDDRLARTVAALRRAEQRLPEGTSVVWLGKGTRLERSDVPGAHWEVRRDG